MENFIALLDKYDTKKAAELAELDRQTKEESLQLERFLSLISTSFTDIIVPASKTAIKQLQDRGYTCEMKVEMSDDLLFLYSSVNLDLTCPATGNSVRLAFTPDTDREQLDVVMLFAKDDIKHCYVDPGKIDTAKIFEKLTVFISKCFGAI